MKRWLLAAGGLMGALLCSARAEYLRITYTLSPTKSLTATAAPEQESGEPGRRRGRRGSLPQPTPPPQTAPTPTAQTPADTAAIKAEAVVEYTRYVMKTLRTGSNTARMFPVISHKWGNTALIPNHDITLAAIQEKGIPLPPVSRRYAQKKKELLKGVKLEDQADKWIELGKWALAHGLTDEVPNVMDNVAKTKSKDPAIISILTAYRTMEAAMKKGPLTRDEAVFARWREKFGSNLHAYHDPWTASPPSGHYTAIYRSESTDPTEVKSFIARLEEHYRGFFYWFALRGTILKVPDYRLVVLMTDNPDQFHFLKQVFDNPVQVEDGFCSRRDNILVCSSVRLDSTYKALNQATQSLWLSGWSKDRLLQGVAKPDATPDENARNQILALVLQAMQEESNIATITNLGTEQLLTATDLIPRGVVAPQWFLFGCCSYFETPRGAYWPGIGAPSWRYLAKWKTLEDKNKLLPSPEAMRMVVSDEMFQNALQSKNEEDILVARTYAWSLVYFLEEMHHGELQQYFAAIRALPRDLQFDPNTLLMTFATSFDLLAAMNHSEVDEVKWEKLAREWYDFLHYTNFEASEAFIDAVKDFGWGDQLKGDDKARWKRPND